MNGRCARRDARPRSTGGLVVGRVRAALGRGALSETLRELAFSVPRPRRTAAATKPSIHEKTHKMRRTIQPNALAAQAAALITVLRHGAGSA